MDTEVPKPHSLRIDVDSRLRPTQLDIYEVPNIWFNIRTKFDNAIPIREGEGDLLEFEEEDGESIILHRVNDYYQGEKREIRYRNSLGWNTILSENIPPKDKRQRKNIPEHSFEISIYNPEANETISWVTKYRYMNDATIPSPLPPIGDKQSFMPEMSIVIEGGGSIDALTLDQINADTLQQITECLDELIEVCIDLGIFSFTDFSNLIK